MPALVHPAASRDPGEGHSMAEPVDDVLDPRVRQHVQVIASGMTSRR